MELPLLTPGHLHFRGGRADPASESESESAKHKRTPQSLVDSHPFNHSVEVIVPACPTSGRRISPQATKQLQEFREGVASLLRQTQYLARKDGQPAQHLLHADFLAETRPSDKTCPRLTVVAPCARIDGPAPPLCIFDGKLVLRLTHDAYQLLGLTGRKYKRHKETVFYTEVDLWAKGFHPGKALFERVLWCLSPERIGTLPLIATCVDLPAHGTGKSFPAEPVQLVGWETMTLHIEERLLEEVHLPALQAIVDVASLDRDKDAVVETLSSAFDWIGMAENHLTRALACSEDTDLWRERFSCLGSFPGSSCAEMMMMMVSVDQESEEEDGPRLEVESGVSSSMKVGDCYTIKGTGMVERAVVHEIMAMSRDLLREGNSVDWIVISVHGFDDTPVSFCSEKGRRYLCSGENGYTLVLFPDDWYWTFVSLDSSEDFTWL